MFYFPLCPFDVKFLLTDQERSVNIKEEKILKRSINVYLLDLVVLHDLRRVYSGQTMKIF